MGLDVLMLKCQLGVDGDTKQKPTFEGWALFYAALRTVGCTSSSIPARCPVAAETSSLPPYKGLGCKCAKSARLAPKLYGETRALLIIL